MKKIKFQYKTTLCYIKKEKFKNHSLSLFVFWTENSFHQNSKVFIFTDSVFLLFNKESIDVLCGILFVIVVSVCRKNQYDNRVFIDFVNKSVLLCYLP